jgi:hypothetical protein
MDIGMYFSQVLMKNHLSLKWEQPLGKQQKVCRLWPTVP